MPRTIVWPVGAAMLLALAGCRGQAGAGRDGAEAELPDAAVRLTMAYDCDSGVSFVATIRRDTAWAFLREGTVSLPPVESDSGTRYSDGTTTLWMQGEGASLETPNRVIRGCHNDRARAVWEHAKLLGADFRAVGNEPGWTLTIAPDSIVLVTDYGETRHAFPAPPAETSDDERRAVYQTAAGGHTIEVVLEAEGCRDGMSGESFETRVTVTLDGGALHGCGRALH